MGTLDHLEPTGMTYEAESSTSLTGLIDQISHQASASSFTPATELLLSIQRAQSQVNSLSLISSNDTIDDLPTSSLRAVLLDSFEAQAYSRVLTSPGDFSARKDVLRKSIVAYRRFLSSATSLSILKQSQSISSVTKTLSSQVRKALSKDASPLPIDATNRRAAKIAALKLERSYKTVLDEYRASARSKAMHRGVIKAGGQGWSSESNGVASTSMTSHTGTDQLEVEYDMLILPGSREGGDDDDNDVEEEDAFVGGEQGQQSDVKAPSSLRTYLLTLCQLHCLLALNALDSTYTELSLLASMPANAESESRQRAGREKDEIQRRRDAGQTDEWKLDQRWGVSNSTPLLDDKGKPNRPFTILPSGNTAVRNKDSMGASAVQTQMDARQQMREQVFQPSHRLPTMSIDEYLAEEERRGNIISGGGQASAEAPTTSELLALRSQGAGVGTREAEEADEEQRRKAGEWDDFAESNPKGMGNTMNRG